MPLFGAVQLYALLWCIARIPANPRKAVSDDDQKAD
jgi:hypothetical protein